MKTVIEKKEYLKPESEIVPDVELAFNLMDDSDDDDDDPENSGYNPGGPNGGHSDTKGSIWDDGLDLDW